MGISNQKLIDDNILRNKMILIQTFNNYFIMPVLLLGVSLPDKKLVRIALTYFYGIGHNTAQKLCSKFSIHNTCRISDLSESQLNAISLELNNMTIESDLRRQVKNNILHHRVIGNYKGKRHAMGYPVRGQRTRTNAKTAKKLNGKWLRNFTTLTNPTITSSTSLSSNVFIKPSIPLMTHFKPFERFFSRFF